jgi:hypothetical protein
VILIAFSLYLSMPTKSTLSPLTDAVVPSTNPEPVTVTPARCAPAAIRGGKTDVTRKPDSVRAAADATPGTPTRQPARWR